MPKSKVDKSRKKKVDQFKKSKKQKNMSQDVNQQLPEIRQVPVWKSQQTIEMNGLEFEAIYNFINNVQSAFGACQSIMNKNILNGAVQINFEKLNEAKNDYVAMTDEEQAPHKAEFKKMVDAAKEQAAKMVRREDLHLEPVNEQEGVPFIDALVDVNGEPISSK